MQYDHKQVLSDLINQIEAMKKRSEKYRAEEEFEGNETGAEIHLRIFCVLKELERLGKAFESRADNNLAPEVRA
jgi:hypothetical protein